jgi:hypothetical protein
MKDMPAILIITKKKDSRWRKQKAPKCGLEDKGKGNK